MQAKRIDEPDNRLEEEGRVRDQSGHAPIRCPQLCYLLFGGYFSNIFATAF